MGLFSIFWRRAPAAASSSTVTRSYAGKKTVQENCERRASQKPYAGAGAAVALAAGNGLKVIMIRKAPSPMAQELT